MTPSPRPGLNHPDSLELWQAWERTRHRGRRAKHAVTGALGALRGRRGGPNGPAARTAWALHSRDGERPERVLLAVDAGTPSIRAALLAFLPYLRTGVDVLAPAGMELPDPESWTTTLDADLARLTDVAEPTSVVSIGQHLQLGALAHRIARRRDVPEYVVQHGVLTPYAPPLPSGATLLAWSDEDAEFWRSGRRDVRTRTVGAQLLWQAAHDGAAADPAARPVFLGQMHGAELPRRLTARTAYRFCRAHDALYRPHPAETDAASRAVHRALRRAGVTFAPTDVPLPDLGAPVVTIFSTGVLEAAARGIPAWVWCPDAPGWVHELWRRYDMRPYGASPTPPPDLADGEPASHVARILEECP